MIKPKCIDKSLNQPFLRRLVGSTADHKRPIIDQLGTRLESHDFERRANLPPPNKMVAPKTVKFE